MDTMQLVLLVLTGLSLLLHFIAPRTKTKADDVAADAVDAVKDGLEAKSDPTK